jgi:phosphatidylglycerophosphate synthase
MKEILKIIKSQQNSNLFYFNFFTRHVSIFFSYIFIKLAFKPNHITILMCIPGVLGAFFLSFGESYMYLISGIFLILHDIFDTSDGEVARYLNEKTYLGIFLDNLVHFIVNTSIIYFGLIGIFKNFLLNFNDFQNIIIVIFLLFTVTENFVKILNKLIIKTSGYEINENKKSKKYMLNEIFLGNIAFFHLIFIFSLFDLIIFKQSYITAFYIFIYAIINLFKFFIRLKFAIKNFN